MAKHRDMWFEITSPGNPRGRVVSPAQIQMLPKVIAEEVNVELKEVSKALLNEIKMAFQTHIRSGKGYRKRNAAYKGARPTTLVQRLVPALVAKLFKEQGHTMGVLIFDLARADKATRNEGLKTWTRGWFMRFVDDHEGRAHGSRRWGFCSLRHAKRLAEQCIVQMNLDRQEAADLKRLVAMKFKGKHDEGDGEDGIMVQLGKPIFFKYPQFGTARKHGIRPHKGYKAWPVWDKPKTFLQGPDFKAMLEAAVERAFDRL